MAVTTKKKTTERQLSELPRDPVEENYFLSRHAEQRIRETDRMINASVVKATIGEGELSENKERGAAEFVLSYSSMTFKVVVNKKPEIGGKHKIRTLFPVEDGEK